ncbi:MAG TPA: beta-galactosidase [bacterium]|nr:beta-galactosidase [bacterium]
MSQVSFDSRALKIDGKRTLIFSGAIHYPRSTPAMWPDLMKRSRAAGLNTVETYVFWNLHEPKRRVYDFSDRLDLLQFCRVAQQHGLYVILRIGPYICAETNYGGFPFWLRDVPDMQMRTFNTPFMLEMGRWVRFLCNHLNRMFAPNGGPIIAFQLENEYSLVALHYGDSGQRYLRWTVDLAQELNLGIPLIMCCGSAPGAIETLNGFVMHPKVQEHVKNHPGQPVLWTENWPGWYDTWGYAHRSRSAEHVAYSVARFFAEGGAGVNYYMWHGGTNFGREAMYLQTTSYDYTAPLDEYGLPTTKSNHLTQLHHVLWEHADLLLEKSRVEPQLVGDNQWIYVYENGTDSLAFLCNDDENKSATISHLGQGYELPALSVILISKGKVLMNTARVAPVSVVQRSVEPISDILAPFECWAEPLPTDWPEGVRAPIRSAAPEEQLQFTQDETDYCWYETRLNIAPSEAGKGELLLEGVADVVYVFVDGQICATTPVPLPEQRGKVDEEGFHQKFELHLNAGTHDLSLLCCAVGLIKGDWMIGYENMVNERKGLWGKARWKGRTLHEPWRIQPGLVGEHCRLFGSAGALVPWQPDGTPQRGKPLCWLRTRFSRPEGLSPLTLDLVGMGKGLIWLNGHCLGRYWLTPGLGDMNPSKRSVIEEQRVNEPTQRYYHVPSEWIQDENVLVLFEEVGGDPSLIRLCRWL